MTLERYEWVPVATLDKTKRLMRCDECSALVLDGESAEAHAFWHDQIERRITIAASLRAVRSTEEER